MRISLPCLPSLALKLTYGSDQFQHYITTTVPYVAALPAQDSFIKTVVPKLRRAGLTKTEALMLINLGIGTPRPTGQQVPAETNGEGDEEEAAAGEEQPEPDDRQLLSLVVEELEERYPGEEGEAQIDTILQIMRDAFDQAKASGAVQNGTAVNGEAPT